MGAMLDALHRLQEVERQLALIRRTRETHERRIAAIQRQIQQVDDRLRELQHRQREHQIRVDALSLEVATREESVARHREGLNRAKTNKEYSAILTAMNTEKADNAKIEGTILEQMELVQTIKDEVTTVESEREQFRAKLAAAQLKLGEVEDASRDQESSLRRRRDECAKAVAPTTLASFTRVAERHEGEAMASVTRLHPKREEYGCSGCNLTLTLDIVNALRTRDEIQLCQSCGRILYLEK